MSDFKRGDLREDGYVFYGMKRVGEKTYQVFMSPLAHKKQLERVKKWRIENRDHALKATREWKLRNPLKVKASRNKWAEANPEKVKEAQKKYKAMKNSLNKDPHDGSNTR